MEMKTIILHEDHYFRKQVIIEDNRVTFKLLGIHKDKSVLPLQYVSVNFKDLERIYQEIKGAL